MDANPPDITILGGGPAGLAAAYYAGQSRLDARLYEASSTFGGNARTLELGSFRFDTGAHRLHDRDPHVTDLFRHLLGDELREVDAPSQIVWRGCRIAFPLAPLDVLRTLRPSTLLRIAGEQLRRLVARHDAPRSFREVAVQAYGPTLARLFLLGYTEKLWGASPDRLAPHVAGGRLEGLDFKTFLLEALGRSRSKARHLDGSFYYPKHGFGSLMDAVAEAVAPGVLHPEARVTRLVHDGRRVRGVSINRGAVRPVSEVVSTLPLNLVLHLLDPAPPAAILEEAAALRFRNVRLAVFGLDRSRLSPNASLYCPDPDVPFTRIYEPKNRSPHLAPPDQTAVVVELPCFEDDAPWTMSPADLRCNVAGYCQRLGLFDDGEVVAFGSYRLPFAYPVLEVDAKERVECLQHYLERFENLHVAGRSARFAYTHVHDLFGDARRLVAGLAGCSGRTSRDTAYGVLEERESVDR